MDLQTVNKHLFDQPQLLFERIRGYPFVRGLPRSEALQDSATARVFKKAVAENGIGSNSIFEYGSEEYKALQNIWSNGWLHAEKSQFGDRYVFATQVHRW